MSGIAPATGSLTAAKDMLVCDNCSCRAQILELQ